MLKESTILKKRKKSREMGDARAYVKNSIASKYSIAIDWKRNDDQSQQSGQIIIFKVLDYVRSLDHLHSSTKIRRVEIGGQRVINTPVGFVRQ